jgi:hypothetical protein
VISQVLIDWILFRQVGEITGFARIAFTPIFGISIEIRKARAFKDNPHFLIHRAD